MALNVRIDPVAHAHLAEVAREQDIPLTEALTRAIEIYRREQLIQQMTADYAAMRADRAAWAEEEADRALWDTTNMDGLEHEPPYPVDENAAPRRRAIRVRQKAKPASAPKRGRARR